MGEIVLECENCGYRWGSDSSGSRTTCPECQRKTKREKIGEQEMIRGKFLYIEAEDIDDMIKATEQQLERLKEMKDNGWELIGGSEDDYSTLQKLED